MYSTHGSKDMPKWINVGFNSLFETIMIMYVRGIRARQIGCPDAQDNQKTGPGSHLLKASCPAGNQGFYHTVRDKSLKNI